MRLYRDCSENVYASACLGGILGYEKESQKAGCQANAGSGYKAVTTFLKGVSYEAMKECASDEEVSHSKYIAGLIVADLVKKKYLVQRFAFQAPAPKKKARKKATKGRRR